MRRLSLFSLTVLIVVAAALPALAADPAAPTVTTGAASGISAKAATLNGAVDPNGASTIYWFEYGTSTSYGLQTGTRDAGSGSSSRSVSAGISGLVAGTTYHLRLVAQNTAGTTDGADQTFTTAAATAPVVVTGAAIRDRGEDRDSEWDVNANGASTIYWFQYGTTTSYGLRPGRTVPAPAQAAHSISAGIFRPRRRRHLPLPACGSEQRRHDRRRRPDFTTTAASAPQVTTGTATGVSAKAATLNGTVNPNGATTTYWFQYGTTVSYGLQTSTRDAGSGTSGRSVSAGISGLAAGTTYHYRLVAQNSAGTTNGQDQTFATTAANAPAVTTGAASGIGPARRDRERQRQPQRRKHHLLVSVRHDRELRPANRNPQRRRGHQRAAESLLICLASRPGPPTTIGWSPRTAPERPRVSTRSSPPAWRKRRLRPPAPPAESGHAKQPSNGTVNPNGTSTTYWFQYGTTTSYGLQTGTHSAGSGTSDRPVSAHLSGLAAGTTYHYRLVAQNAAGTTQGADQTFTTSAASAPTVTTGRAFGVGRRSAFVSGTVNANGTPTTYGSSTAPRRATACRHERTTSARGHGAGTSSRSCPA